MPKFKTVITALALAGLCAAAPTGSAQAQKKPTI